MTGFKGTVPDIKIDISEKYKPLTFICSQYEIRPELGHEWNCFIPDIPIEFIVSISFPHSNGKVKIEAKMLKHGYIPVMNKDTCYFTILGTNFKTKEAAMELCAKRFYQLLEKQLKK